VHGDAQRAMVRRALLGVQVSNLDHGQKGHEEKAHDGSDRPGAGPDPPSIADLCLVAGQAACSSLPSIHRSWTQAFPGRFGGDWVFHACIL
jgi:hypothetical protein